MNQLKRREIVEAEMAKSRARAEAVGTQGASAGAASAGAASAPKGEEQTPLSSEMQREVPEVDGGTTSGLDITATPTGTSPSVLADVDSGDNSDSGDSSSLQGASTAVSTATSTAVSTATSTASTLQAEGEALRAQPEGARVEHKLERNVNLEASAPSSSASSTSSASSAPLTSSDDKDPPSSTDKYLQGLGPA